MKVINFKHKTRKEISKMACELEDKVWYDKYLVIIDKKDWKQLKDFRNKKEWDATSFDIKAAHVGMFYNVRNSHKHARKLLDKYGKKNLGPYNDFEWGKLMGKLQALRWAMGWGDWDDDILSDV